MSSSGDRAQAQRVAERMLSDPQFRYDVEAELAKAQDTDHKRLKQLREMFALGDDPGRVWIWINGLKTFGEGDTWTEAYHDALDEIVTHSKR